MNSDQIAQQLLYALGNDVRLGVVSPLNAVRLLLREWDIAQQEGKLGRPEFAETAKRLAAFDDIILTLIHY